MNNEKQNKANNEKQNKAVTFLEDLLKDAKAGNLNNKALQLLLQEPDAMLSRAPAVKTVNNTEAGTTTTITSS